MIENFKLKVLHVVAGNLNYRRAVDELHITQPAVTAQIRSLEESLGIALFDRSAGDGTVRTTRCQNSTLFFFTFFA